MKKRRRIVYYDTPSFLIFAFLRSGAYGTLTYNFTKYHKLATIY